MSSAWKTNVGKNELLNWNCSKCRVFAKILAFFSYWIPDPLWGSSDEEWLAVCDHNAWYCNIQSWAPRGVQTRIYILLLLYKSKLGVKACHEALLMWYMHLASRHLQASFQNSCNCKFMPSSNLKFLSNSVCGLIPPMTQRIYSSKDPSNSHLYTSFNNPESYGEEFVSMTCWNVRVHGQMGRKKCDTIRQQSSWAGLKSYAWQGWPSMIKILCSEMRSPATVLGTIVRTSGLNTH